MNRTDSVGEAKLMNQAVVCPWTSTAPLQSVTVMKVGDGCSGESKESPACGAVEDERNRLHNSENNNAPGNKDESKPETTAVKNSSSQFFHFLRLMQLFPSVHPATLHTVMTLCKNDFFVAVDKLLYAKRCKELYQNRRNLYQNFPNRNQRFAPYACNQMYCPNVGCIKPRVIKLDTKKMVSRSRYTKVVTEKQESSSSCASDLTPVTLHCNVPIRPLSPTPEDLSTSNSNDNVQK